VRVFKNRVLKKTFGSKTDKVTREWRRLHKEELCHLYSSPNIIQLNKKNEVSGVCGTYGSQERLWTRIWW
jgi:hypothetical protein